MGNNIDRKAYATNVELLTEVETSRSGQRRAGAHRQTRSLSGPKQFDRRFTIRATHDADRSPLRYRKELELDRQ